MLPSIHDCNTQAASSKPTQTTPALVACSDNNWTLTLKRELAETEYKVTAVTGSVADGGFDGAVYVK